MRHCLAALIVAVCIVAKLPAQSPPGEVCFDQYGGYLSIKGTATGRFHLEVIDGRHFLVTPEGHAFIALGVTHTGAIGRLSGSEYNYLEEKCGGDWNRVTAEVVTNLRRWGFNSLGYDSFPQIRNKMPYFAGCQTTPVSVWLGKKITFPDVFSDQWKKQARQILENSLKYRGSGPNLIGIYWTDTPAWSLEQQRRLVGKTWVDAIRALPVDAPGRKRYEQFLQQYGANATDEDFLVIIAREIYSYLGPLTRKLAPNTLIFGERYCGWRLPWRVIKEELPYVDVVSVQPAGSEFPRELFTRLYRETGKPIMICDHAISFQVPEYTAIMWDTMPAASEAGQAYRRYLLDALSMPFIIGYDRCQYIDRYQTHLQVLKQGLVAEDGTPHKELIEWVSKANWDVHRQFWEWSASRKKVFSRSTSSK